MAVNPELQKWLLEKITPALADQERQTFESILAKEQVAQVFNEGLAGRSEINRRLDEIRNEKAQLESNLRSELTNYYETWRNGEQSKVNNQVAQLQAQYDRDVAALRAQVEAEGLQPTVAQPVKPTAAPTNSNGNGHLSQQDIQRMVQQELSKAAMLPALVTQINEEHRRLYGQTPDMTKVTETALRTGRSLQDTWREMYKVADKEAEIQQADIQKKINDGIQEGLTKALADGAMNQQNFSGRPEQPSVIRQMLMAKQQEGNSPLAVPQPVQQQSEGVNQAIELLRSGKFAVKYPGQA